MTSNQLRREAGRDPANSHHNLHHMFPRLSASFHF
ncbi:unnamed protein product [Rodentolepis nana]|uniref:Uncharacterized protein n=1 Tax=Rodentolepis nana TaxID=102285 RepID=A0A3P7S556_RODNA|nr:unnamed protein product [Rodentolepis nana]